MTLSFKVKNNKWVPPLPKLDYLIDEAKSSVKALTIFFLLLDKIIRQIINKGLICNFFIVFLFRILITRYIYLPFFCVILYILKDSLLAI